MNKHRARFGGEPSRLADLLEILTGRCDSVRDETEGRRKTAVDKDPEACNDEIGRGDGGYGDTEK